MMWQFTTSPLAVPRHHHHNSRGVRPTPQPVTLLTYCEARRRNARAPGCRVWNLTGLPPPSPTAMAALAAAAAMVGGGEHDLPNEEVDAMLASFSAGDPDAAAFAPPPEPEVGTSPLPVGIGEIERFLMDDTNEAAVDATGVGIDEFLDAILIGDGESNGVPDPTGEGSVGGLSVGEDEEVMGVDGDDDPDSKKKLRRVRNRDSAMKSRERKRLYLKDLETKSKYLEAECCRLSYTLQCCSAENMVLRQCLLKDRLVGAPTAMQESAVLMETLPLVSLLWLVCIAHLFLIPGVTNRSLVAPSGPVRDPVKLGRMVTNTVKMIRMTTNCVNMNSDARGALELFRHGRCYKGRKARMKFPWLPWQQLLPRLSVIL